MAVKSRLFGTGLGLETSGLLGKELLGLLDLDVGCIVDGDAAAELNDLDQLKETVVLFLEDTYQKAFSNLFIRKSQR